MHLIPGEVIIQVNLIILQWILNLNKSLIILPKISCDLHFFFSYLKFSLSFFKDSGPCVCRIVSHSLSIFRQKTMLASFGGASLLALLVLTTGCRASG